MVKIFTNFRLVNKMLMLAACLCAATTQSGAQVWNPIATNAPHYNAGVMLLLTDGTVLCKTSSGTGNGTKWDKLTPDIHGSYANGTWSTVAAMNYDRLYFSTQVLQDGRVYVAGGEYGAGGERSEVYDPVSNTWTMCPSIITGLPGISDANSMLLPNGKVLQAVVSAGGTKTNYIWDPITNTYSGAASCLRTDNEAPWVKLPDNSIVFVDAYGTSAERYIPATNTWHNEGGAGTVPVSLYDPYGSEAGGGFLLPDGRVWFIGSRATSAYYTPSGSPTISGTWTAGPAIPGGHGAPDAASAMMVNGNVLLAVSDTPTSANHFPDSTVFKTFDYVSNTYTPITPPWSSVVDDTTVMPCYYSNMLVLPDGKVLYSTQGDDSYYEFAPASAPLAAGKPTISTIIENTCTNYTITGTLFNGISEGACYGDDWQMVTNYPIVRLTSGTNVYYARTSNWNSTGVMRGSAPDTATFTTPVGLADGLYNVEVVVNGNPSATYALNVGKAILSPLSNTVCSANNITVSAGTPGGVWSSANTTLATVGTSTGVVTGNAAGSTLISYSLGTCVSTASVTVLSSPAAISPATASVCKGANVSLTDATFGGVWSTSSSSVASITGGNVTGNNAGIATISYTQGGCYVTASVVVNPLPSFITGTMNVCSGLTTPLSDATALGAWTSGNTGVATITSSGVVTGGSAGTSVITYTLPTGCLTSSVFTVGSSASPISGSAVMCLGGSVSLSDSSPGGTWTSSNTGIATVGASSGIVTGAALGTATITYSLSLGCTATKNVTVSSTLFIVPSVTLSVSPGTSLCSSSSPVSYVPNPVNGGSAPAYKWYVNGSIAATSSTYAYVPANGDVIKCLLTSSASCTMPDTASAFATMTISPVTTPSVAITLSPGNGQCEGKLATFTAATYYGGTAPSYLWTKNSVNVGTGPSYAYYPANGDVVNCQLTSDYLCATVNVVSAAPVLMNVAAPSVNSIAIKVTHLAIAAGQMDTFTAVAPHAGSAPVYQWYLNGFALPGENKATYVTNKLASGDIVKCAVTTSDDCTSPSKAISGGISVKVGAGVGFTEVSNSIGGFTLVPNPNTGAFTINGALSDPADGKVSVSVTNLLGQIVYSRDFAATNGIIDQHIELQHTIANGTYLVTVTSGDQHVVFHMVINQ